MQTATGPHGEHPVAPALPPRPCVAELEKLVLVRTAELQASNHRLRTEIAERERAESELACHRDRFEELVQARTAELVQANQLLQRQVKIREKAEAALQESEGNFRAMADNAAEAIVLQTRERTVYANPYVTELTGYGPDEFVRLPIASLLAPGEAEKIADITRRRLRGESVTNPYETALRHKDGRTVPVEVAASLTVWRGHPATVGLLRNIANRKAAELALRQSERRLEHALTSLAAATDQAQSGCTSTQFPSAS